MAVILGIESSCDDTAAAVLDDGVVESSIISSQDIHGEYGGVVPELASRAHQRLIVPVTEKALDDASYTVSDIDLVAATYGPGLAGSLLVGLNFAKAFALAEGLPFLGVNHLAGHVFSVFLEDDVEFPYLCMIVSGGHSQLVQVDGYCEFTVLGQTRDDAAGEAFDKVATLFGLGYPGGPAIDGLAGDGRDDFHDFPRADIDGFDFSFSGLKTSVLYYLNEYSEDERRTLLENHLADLCASFQAAVIDALLNKLTQAIDETGISDVAIVGGVSANSRLRRHATGLADEKGFRLYIPPLTYCMDNAAMIAQAGLFYHRMGRQSDQTLAVAPNLSLTSSS